MNKLLCVAAASVAMMVLAPSGQAQTLNYNSSKSNSGNTPPQLPPRAPVAAARLRPARVRRPLARHRHQIQTAAWHPANASIEDHPWRESDGGAQRKGPPLAERLGGAARRRHARPGRRGPSMLALRRWRIDGRRCGGMYKTTFRADWETCPGCGGRGFTGSNSRCSMCQTSDWAFRKPLWEA